MAEDAQKIIAAEVRRDVGGDEKFSGWAPKLVTEVKFTPTGAAIVHPTRTSAGPFTVADIGRNQGNAGGMAGPGVSADGTTRRKDNGTVRNARKRKGVAYGKVGTRWNGRTRAKHTWSEAVADMERESPKLLEAAIVKKVGGWF